MGRLFINEWIKVKYSKMLWILYGIILVYVILMGGMPTGTMGWGEYGATAPYGYLRNCGTLVMMFLSPMVGIFFTQEFAQGTMHNTLSCGVSRRDYFMVKLVCVLISGYLVYFCSLLVFTGIRCLVAGYRPLPASALPAVSGNWWYIKRDAVFRNLPILLFFFLYR